MRALSPNVIAIVLIAIGLAVPAGAVVGDQVGGGIVLEPHSGPNGQYASLDGNGNLTIDLGDELNPDAVASFEGVFNVSNTGSDDVRVWIDHTATQHVEFRTARSGSIEGSGTVLSPGETVTVDVTVDTHGAAPGTQLIDDIEVHATRTGPTSAPTPTTSTTGGSGGGGGGGGLQSAPTGAPDDPVDGTIVGSGTVMIEFDRGIRSGERIHVERLEELPPDPGVEGVFPVATRVSPEAARGDPSPVTRERLRELEVDSVATAGESVTLSGRRTRFDTASSIDDRRKTAVVHEITPPPRLEDGWATVWISVERSRFGDDDPSDARVARRTPDGWHLLETRLVRANATDVVLRARTPGFSAFAVFRAPAVTYRWTFDGEGTVEAEEVAVTYDDPGIYTGTLTVTDARGRSNSTAHRLLVNDRPSVQVETPPTIEPGERVTLTANVIDEYGSTNVTWKFEDGAYLQGRTVTRTFDGGEHAATVTVEDEFGATGEARVSFVAGGRDPVVQVVEFALGVEGRLALVALLTLGITGTLRWLVDRSGVGATRRSR